MKQTRRTIVLPHSICAGLPSLEIVKTSLASSGVLGGGKLYRTTRWFRGIWLIPTCWKQFNYHWLARIWFWKKHLSISNATIFLPTFWGHCCNSCRFPRGLGRFIGFPGDMSPWLSRDDQPAKLCFDGPKCSELEYTDFHEKGGWFKYEEHIYLERKQQWNYPHFFPCLPDALWPFLWGWSSRLIVASECVNIWLDLLIRFFLFFLEILDPTSVDLVEDPGVAFAWNHKKNTFQIYQNGSPYHLCNEWIGLNVFFQSSRREIKIASSKFI